MRQFLTIATNAFMELVRQPVFLLLTTSSAAFIIFLSSVSYFGFGDDPLLVKQSVLAVMLLTGLFGSVISASASLAREIRSGTALAVLAKPVGRANFLLAKYAGLAGAITLMTFVNMLCALLASRMAFDAYGDPDKLGLKIFFSLMLLAYLLGGFTNYFLRRPFVSDAVMFLVLMVMASFVVINCLDKEGHWQTFAKGVDWRMLKASILILFALWVLAGAALACATRVDLIPTLAICTGLFLLGLMSDYLFGRKAEAGSWWATVLHTMVPDWQVFWLADALEPKRVIPWGYVTNALAYVGGYLGAMLALALLLFEDRELS